MNTTPTTRPLSASVPLSLDLSAARQLRDGLATLLGAERTAAADFLLALSDFDRRKGWELLGHASLFAFLRVELGLSRSAAFWRLSAARLLQQFPDVIEPLRDGRLCLSTTAELAKVLTVDNQAEVLPRYFGLSAREAQEVTAELMPRADPPRRSVVTAVPPAPSSVSLRLTPVPQVAIASPMAQPVLTSELPNRAVPRDDIEPLTADLRRLHFTVTKQFLKKLDAARDGLSHTIPGATTEQVLEAALDLLLEQQARRRGLVKRPRKGAPAPAPASAETDVTASAEPLHRRPGPRKKVPAEIRRAVWERDQGRCVWPLDSGGVCGSTHQVEVDHSAVPWARGGQATLANLRLLCHTHNRLAAKLAFGARCVDRYSGAAGRPRAVRSRPKSRRIGRAVIGGDPEPTSAARATE